MAQHKAYVGLTIESFEDLDEALGKLNNLETYVNDWMDANSDTYIQQYITEHGLEVGYTVTDGDLAVVLQ